jgi:hypothetical protein
MGAYDSEREAKDRAYFTRGGGGGLSEESPGYGQRFRYGLKEGGGLLGGLLALAADPYAESSKENPSWYDALEGPVQRVRGGIRAGLANDPMLPYRERALDMEEASAALRSNAYAIKLRDAQRQEDMIKEFEESGLDPTNPKDRDQITSMMFRHGDLPHMMKMLELADKGRAAPTPVKFQSGGQNVTRLYDRSGEIEEYTAPRKIVDPTTPLGTEKATSGLADDYQRRMSRLLQGRDLAAQVGPMIDSAIATDNPAEALAGIRLYVSSLDQGVVREEELRGFFDSLGYIQGTLDQWRLASSGQARTELARKVRDAANNAVSRLNDTIENNERPFRERAGAANIPWSHVASPRPVQPPVGAGNRYDSSDTRNLPGVGSVEREAIGLNEDGSVLYRYFTNEGAR